MTHRTVRCVSRATATSRQRSSTEGIKCATVRARVRAERDGAPDSEQCLSGAPPDCPVAQKTESPTVRIQRSGHVVGAPDSVRWRTGLSDVPAEQRLLRANSRLQNALNALQCAPESEQRLMAHRTVNSACPVHHRTVRCPRRQKLQRSESNGQVTWQAHRTVRCTMRQQPPPNG